MSPAQVVEYIRHESGRHFDPSVVAVFLRIMEEDSPEQEMGASAAQAT
jgi:HD-GYP domain-containing protein (c-di-GMP phosphodiesterase class II)